MIVFEGEFSEKLKKKVLGLHAKHIFLALLLTAVIWCTPCIILGIIFDTMITKIMMYTSVCISCILLLLSAIYRERPKNYGKIMPRKVIIEDDAIISVCENIEYYRYMSDVKKVIDRGDAYFFVFYFPHKNVTYICQKTSVVQGTIEEFERIFENKIVRKV